jgi:hypothetical protein
MNRQCTETRNTGYKTHNLYKQTKNTTQKHVILDTRHTTYKLKTQHRNTSYWIQDTQPIQTNQKHNTETRHTGYKTHNV